MLLLASAPITLSPGTFADSSLHRALFRVHYRTSSFPTTLSSEIGTWFPRFDQCVYYGDVILLSTNTTLVCFNVLSCLGEPQAMLGGALYIDFQPLYTLTALGPFRHGIGIHNCGIGAPSFLAPTHRAPHAEQPPRHLAFISFHMSLNSSSPLSYSNIYKIAPLKHH